MPGLLNVRDLDADKKPTGQLDQSEMTLAGIGALAFLLPTPLQVDKDEFAEPQPRRELDVLARSSKRILGREGRRRTRCRCSASTPPPREEWGSSVLVARAPAGRSGPIGRTRRSPPRRSRRRPRAAVRRHEAHDRAARTIRRSSG